jgi:hypothetical protein
VSEPSYYHVAAGLYRPGDMIYPGTWGRLIQGTGPDHALYFRELAFEAVRSQQFPECVSRMAAAFAFTNVDAANQHLSAIAPPGSLRHYVYSVRIDDAEPHDLLDMSWFDAIREYRSFEATQRAITAYWSGVHRGPEKLELLSAGPLTIIDRVTPITENGHS